MATQQERITSLAQAIAADIKRLTANQGTLTALTTTDKTSLVKAINELKSSIANATNINDTSTSTSATWSSDKINSSINNAVSALVNGASTTLDTLNELADALGNDANFATTIAAQMGKRVRVDAPQTFTVTEQAQGCANLGIGNPDTDFVAAYNTAKA
jgi:hypothetical protein